jgi:GntR family transcriptional regulator, trigonelline degradation regulator
MPIQSDGLGDFSLRVGRVTAPLREQAAQVIRRAILEFRFKPGQRLIERDLIEQTGVSRTTIREVLRQLAAEGLVTTIPQKGVVVVSLTEEEVADLYEVRVLLESFVGRRFAQRATDEQVKELRAGFKELSRSLRGSKDIQERLAAKDRFYDLLLEGAGNPQVRALLGSLQERVRLMRARSLSQPGRVKKTLKEIEAIVDAIEARDPDAAAAASEHHVMESARAAKLRIRAMEESAQADQTPAASSA